MEIRLEVNGRFIEAEKGETLLAALNRNGIDVPTICSMKGLSPSGACRMCVVEVTGKENLVPACSFPVEESLTILTHSPRVLKARKTNVELLLASHPDDCLYCERNGTCELQSLAEDLNIRERHLPGKRKPFPVDKSSPAMIRDPSKCILCGRCVRVCEEIMGTSTLEFAHRGNALRITTALEKPLNFSNCTACGQCVVSCPTGALIEKVQYPDVEAHIHDPGKIVVAQYSPAVATSVAEMLGYKPGTEFGGMINAVLRRYGFDYVFQSAYGVDVMIMEQVRILESRLARTHSLPLLTSSCPAWIRFVEQFYPELIRELSPLKSPQQLMGSLIREWLPRNVNIQSADIVSVMITSCIAAKSEAHRAEMTHEGIPTIDLVLSTRELARLIRLSGLDLNKLKPEPPDPPFRSSSTAGMLTGIAGGETEATLRTLFRHMTGSTLSQTRLHRFRVQKPYREISVKAGENEIRMGCVHGLAHARSVLKELMAGKKSLDLLEVMACPEGCGNGGGQPVPLNTLHVRQRSKTLYEIDNGSTIHDAYQNPDLQQLYDDFLIEPGETQSRRIFYTPYVNRDDLK